MIRLYRRERINSLLVSACIAETNICAILDTFFTIPMVSVLLLVLICVIGVLLNGKRLHITSNSVIAYVLFMLLLVFSIFLNGFSVAGERMLYFLSFGTTAMLVVNTKYDTRLILKYLLYIYAIHLIVYFLFQRVTLLDSDDYWRAQMGVAYGFVPSIIVCIIFLLFRDKLVDIDIFNNHKWMQFLFYAVILFASVYVCLIDCGTRGVIVVAIVGLTLLILRKLSKKQRVLFGIIGAAFLLFIHLNWNTILSSSLDRFAESNVKALVKLSQLIEYGDVSNGRENHYDVAIKMIKENPILGYGVGFFENQTKASYVHQLFLELMLDCGLFGTILFLIPIFKLIKKTRKENDDIAYSFKVVLLSCSFLPLLFSSSFWLYPPFWVGYFYALKHKNH